MILDSIAIKNIHFLPFSFYCAFFVKKFKTIAICHLYRESSIHFYFVQMIHIAIAAVGVTVGVALFTTALPLIGFTTQGISAGSIASQMMASAAVASGGGVAAGSFVSTLQSIGAAGIGLAGAGAAILIPCALGGIMIGVILI